MYCPVYGCNSDFKKNSDRLVFFAFPSEKNQTEKIRRKQWIKSSNLQTTQDSVPAIFSDDSFVPSHSPALLASIGFKSKVKYILKDDAIPTQNKPRMLYSSCSQADNLPCGKLCRVKVRTPKYKCRQNSIRMSIA